MSRKTGKSLIIRKYCLNFDNHEEHIFGRMNQKTGEIERFVCPGYDDR